MRYRLSLAAVLFGFWLVLSGHYEPFLLAAGIGTALACVFLASRRLGITDREGHPVDLLGNAVRYWPWLLKEIVKSAWDVARIVVHPRLPISPTMVRAPASQRTPLGIVAYANSITLTPGTISVDIAGQEILVHALTRGGAESLLEGDMDRRVAAFEGRA